MGKRCNSPSFFFYALQSCYVSVTIIKASVYPADGGGAYSGFFHDLAVDHSVGQHTRHKEPLLEGDELVDRTQIGKKGIALVNRFE